MGLAKRRSASVPNAPCGVERVISFCPLVSSRQVPNAPCGVERRTGGLVALWRQTFLMHRVELKVYALLDRCAVLKELVPNAPCGVERSETVF